MNMKRYIAMVSIVALSLPLVGSPGWGQDATQQQDAQQQAQTENAKPAAPQPKNIKEWVSVNRSRKSALKGALLGALGGALIAGARGKNPLAGAAVGAVAGGVAGYLVGRHQDKVYYSRDQAIQMAGYKPSDGYALKIQDVRFDPETIKPGEKATLHIRYLVIGPDPNETIKINCYRGIKYQGSYMTGEQATLKVPRGGGVVESTAEFTLPAEAPVGTYTAEALMEDEGGRMNQSGTSPLYIAS
jgi:outer membrane lipoprotein SlyB